ncbi:hypothetical protein Tco_1116872, partial [Tanacetum coccineum]
MSTSKTYQQSLADASSETRPPMLERGSYIPWASRFRRYINRKRENQKWLNKALDEGPYQFEMFIPNNSTVPKLQTAEDLQGDALLHYDAEMELMNLILLSIPNDIYNSVDACTSAKDMWKRVERLMRGTIQNKVDRETRFTNEFDQFVAEPGEALVSVYNRFAQLMNDLERNDMHFPIQFEKLVNVSREKKLEKYHDPLALVAHTGSSSRNTSSYYVTHPTSVVDYEDEYHEDDVHTNSEDPLASAMLVNIQSRNSGSAGRNNRRAYVQEEIIEGLNAPNETENVQSNIGDDQIDSDIIFDSPNGNVNSGSIKKDTHVHDLYLEAKQKKNVDLILKLGNSLQGMFMLGPKPLYVYDQQLKHGLGYPNPYTPKQAISQCPKLYLASSLGNSEISLNIRDTEDTLDDASKNCVPQKELSAEQKYFSSSFIPSDKNSNETPSIPASMP